PRGDEGLALPEAGQDGAGARGLEEGAGARSLRHRGCRGPARPERRMMHALTGLLGFAAVLAGAVLLQRTDAGFAGFIYRPALLLIGLGPLFVAAIPHTFGELWECVGEIGRALRFSVEASRAGLARVAPATGLVGTTLGLIALLKDLRNFEQLGPSMALALLCTLYGLLLANGLYQPLARLLHVRAVAAQEEARLLTRALVLLGEGKPLADARALFGPQSAAPQPSLDLAAG